VIDESIIRWFVFEVNRSTFKLYVLNLFQHVNLLTQLRLNVTHVVVEPLTRLHTKIGLTEKRFPSNSDDDGE